jgi:hypothetical protein
MAARAPPDKLRRSLTSAAVILTGKPPYIGEPKKPDFDALRGRSDFQKLVAEVENKGAMK